MRTTKAQLPRLAAGDSLGEIVQVLGDHGAVIIEEMLPRDVRERMLADLGSHIEAADPKMRHVSPVLQTFFGERTRHVASLAGKSPTFANEVLIHPVFMGICDHFLLPSCARYQLNLGHLIVRGPGAEAQVFHRDQGNWMTYMPSPHPEVLVSSMTALNGFTIENGATMVVPDSHHWDLERKPEPDEIVHAEMPAGSTVVYLGSTLHAAGDNTSGQEWRIGMHLSYTLGWLRTEENNYLGCPPGVARTLVPAAQEMLGYAIHDSLGAGGGYLGMIELQDPLEWMASDRQ